MGELDKGQKNTCERLKKRKKKKKGVTGRFAYLGKVKGIKLP